MNTDAPSLALMFGVPLVFGVAFASCAGGAWLARRAATRAAMVSRATLEGTASSSFDRRSVMVAELLLASLREGGAQTLARLPQATPEEQRADPLSVHEKVVLVTGTVRDLRFERGLFTGRMKLVSGEDAYFVTPIGIEGVAVDQECSFRGIPVTIRAREPTNEPKAILVGAFDGC